MASSEPRTLDQLAFPRLGEAAAIPSRVHRFVSEKRLFTPGERVVLGVSGGADSTALALLLSSLRTMLSLTLHIAHFNHRLRGREEAKADGDFVRRLAARLSIPCSVGSGDTARYADQNGLSIEDAARRLRYRFLGQVAGRTGATAVAVGHTGDDQAETVLLHLIRGAGLDGLRGMLPRATWPFGSGPDLVRPLLALSRSDTELLNRELEIVPREDPTNLAPSATRNRIRHEVMPLLREINPLVDQALNRLANIAAAEVAYMESQADSIWNRVVKRETDREIIFNARELLTLVREDSPIAVRLLVRGVRRLGGAGMALESVHLTSLLSSLRGDSRRWRQSLPGGLTVAAGVDYVRVFRGDVQAPDKLPETRLAVPGRTQVGPWLFQAALIPVPKEEPRPRRFMVRLDADAIRGGLTVRSRRPGDRLRPLGLGGAKKVQDVLVDAKVPAEERDGVPIVCDEAGIIWVVGHCIDERVALAPTTELAVRLTASRKQSCQEC